MLVRSVTAERASLDISKVRCPIPLRSASAVCAPKPTAFLLLGAVDMHSLVHQCLCNWQAISCTQLRQWLTQPSRRTMHALQAFTKCCASQQLMQQDTVHYGRVYTQKTTGSLSACTRVHSLAWYLHGIMA